MTASTSHPVSSEAATPLPASVAEIDASCRKAVLFLFGAAIFWLVVGSVVQLLASIKVHGPNFLADLPWLTYGRVRPAFINIFLYGFASQAAFGVALWLMARLSRTVLFGGVIAIIGALVWNLGVAIGVGGILGGDASGFSSFDMPRYASPILFFAFLPIGMACALTFANRQERTTYPSQWFIIAAFLVFPWITATANLLLLMYPVRGAMQAVVNYWYSSSFITLWLTPIGLASVFYFGPKITGRPLYSYQLAVASFWMWIFVAGWAGVPPGAPVPAWISSVSSVASLLLIAPLVGFVLNWRNTLSNATAEKRTLPLRFHSVAMLALAVAVVATAIITIRAVANKVEFTFVTVAVQQLWLYGFFAMAMFGAIYYIAAQLICREWCASRAKVHFLCSSVGIAMIAIGLAAAGIIQGNIQTNPNEPLIKAVKATAPFIGISTLGVLLLLAGHVAFLSNFAKIACACCLPRVKTKETKKGGRK